MPGSAGPAVPHQQASRAPNATRDEREREREVLGSVIDVARISKGARARSAQVDVREDCECGIWARKLRTRVAAVIVHELELSCVAAIMRCWRRDIQFHVPNVAIVEQFFPARVVSVLAGAPM